MKTVFSKEEKDGTKTIVSNIKIKPDPFNNGNSRLNYYVSFNITHDPNNKGYGLGNYYYSLFGVLHYLNLYLSDNDYSELYKRIIYTNEFLPEKYRLEYLHDCL